MIRFTLDDVEVPVEAEDGPRFSFSLLDLEDPESIRGSEGVSIKMPATRDVRRVLGGPGLSETIARRRPTLRAGNEGQVLYQSKAIARTLSKGQYSVVAIGDNAEWFELAKAQRLRELNMGVSETITDTLMRDSWVDENTTLAFPPIDFGSFEDRTSAFNVTVNKIRPAIRTHQFLKAAFAQWGYSLQPMGSLGTLWKKLVIPNTDGDIPIGADFLRNSTATYIDLSNQTFTALGDHNVNFDTALFDPSGTYTAPGRYDPPFDLRAEVKFTFDMTAIIAGPAPVNTMYVRFELWNFTTGQSMASAVYTMSTFQLTEADTVNFGEFDLTNAQLYGIRVRLISPGTTIHAIGFSAAQVEFDVRGIEYQEGVTVDVSGQAPDMTAMEVLKGIAGNRCLILRTNSAHANIELWYDTEFYRGTDVGIDWKPRMDHSTFPVKEVPLYTVRLEYRWKEDSKDRDLLKLSDTVDAPGYGNYDKEMPDGTKDAKRIEMPFAPTAMGYLFGGNVFWPVSRKDGGTYQQDDYDRETRLLIMDGMADGAWTFDGVLETQYPRTYFINPEGRYTLAFGTGEVYGDTKLGTAQLQWADRQRRMMTPVLRADVMIYHDEIWNLDQGVPRQINDGYDDVWVYVQQINQFSFSEPAYTETVLIPL